mgnify:CR=1 FL=1
MYALVYISEADQLFEPSTLQALADNANRRNRLLSITGFLTYKEGQFLQYLEGGEKAVNDLMNTIQNDPRHTVIKVIKIPGQPQRYLNGWHMRYLSGLDLKSVSLDDLLAGTLNKLDSKIYSEEKVLQLVQRILIRFSRYFEDNPQAFFPPL